MKTDRLKYQNIAPVYYTKVSNTIKVSCFLILHPEDCVSLTIFAESSIKDDRLGSKYASNPDDSYI